MTRLLSLTLLSCSLVFFAGCVVKADPDTDTENPFEGTFAVTSHTRDETGCTGPGADVTDGDAFFNLKEENFFGTPFLAYRSCTDASTCDESANLFGSFINEGNGWVRDVKSSSGTDPCSLTLVEGPLVETETGFRLESRTFKGEVMLKAGEECDPDLADTRRAELTCTAIEILVADKL
jgi:hypothetical protein